MTYLERCTVASCILWNLLSTSHNFSCTAVVFHGSQNWNSYPFLKQPSNHIPLTRPHCAGYAHTEVASVTPYKSAHRYQRFERIDASSSGSIPHWRCRKRLSVEGRIYLPESTESHPRRKSFFTITAIRSSNLQQTKQPCSLYQLLVNRFTNFMMYNDQTKVG